MTGGEHKDSCTGTIGGIDRLETLNYYYEHMSVIIIISPLN
jgi:hypothetical protein